VCELRRERKGSGFSPNYDAYSTLTRIRKPSAAVRPSAVEKGGSGISLDYNTIQHAHAQNKPSVVEKGIPPIAMQHNTPRSGNESDFKQSKKV
jgi:hypothetical protein